ncbi:hypothetical protein PAHAL_9G163600 [Panicum hallii]|uniref:Replication factor A protein 3 n=1 Tax=Panicum hallii TaxID=206008 RepID=A0A2T8I1I6_9POAL|nr:replication protein A 14 kDa subunit-like [Panicum hallii]PVH31502.1 hypothetical protein PAHAL_9G163600 [Panicum hallii]
MDASGLPAFANGEMLKTLVGRRVRTVVQVQHDEGGLLVGQSTDGHQLTIRGAMDVPVSHFMEVFGTADSDQSICAEVCTDFGNDFDAEAFNGLCKFANKVKEPFL